MESIGLEIVWKALSAQPRNRRQVGKHCPNRAAAGKHCGKHCGEHRGNHCKPEAQKDIVLDLRAVSPTPLLTHARRRRQAGDGLGHNAGSNPVAQHSAGGVDGNALLEQMVALHASLLAFDVVAGVGADLEGNVRKSCAPCQQAHARSQRFAHAWAEDGRCMAPRAAIKRAKPTIQADLLVQILGGSRQTPNQPSSSAPLVLWTTLWLGRPFPNACVRPTAVNFRYDSFDQHQIQNVTGGYLPARHAAKPGQRGNENTRLVQNEEVHKEMALLAYARARAFRLPSGEKTFSRRFPVPTSKHNMSERTQHNCDNPVLLFQLTQVLVVVATLKASDAR